MAKSNRRKAVINVSEETTSEHTVSGNSANNANYISIADLPAKLHNGRGRSKGELRLQLEQLPSGMSVKVADDNATKPSSLHSTVREINVKNLGNGIDKTLVVSNRVGGVFVSCEDRRYVPSKRGRKPKQQSTAKTE